MEGRFRIMTWNANGLLQHKDDLLAILIEQKIDVCLISETHFTKQSYLKMRGYKIYHAVHPQNSARGGSAVMVKEELIHHEYKKIELQEFQSISVKVKLTCHSSGMITIAAVYCPPRFSLKKPDYCDFLRNFTGKFIIGGDFNSKNTRWGSRLTTTKGKELQLAVDEYNCEVHSTRKPTYWPTDRAKIPDLLDFFITKYISPNTIEVEEEFDLNSDHSPIVLTIHSSAVKKPGAPQLINKYTDIESLKHMIENKIDLDTSLQTTEELENEVQEFVTSIQQSAWENTPPLQSKIKGNCYPQVVRELIAERRRTRRIWQTTRDPRSKIELNRITQNLRGAIHEIKQQEINTYLEELSNEASTNYSLWRATKKIKRPVEQVAPIRKEDGTWAHSSKEKVVLFANHLEKTFTPHDDRVLNDGINVIIQPRLLDNIPPTSPREVKKEINNMAKKKSPGYDLITGEILQHLPRKAIVKLSHIFNAAFRLKYVPSLWKVAEVIMLPKPGKSLNEVTSYRPISLLPVLSKLFERLLLARLKPILQDKQLIPSHQFGFRSKHSTIDQVHRITDVIERCLEEKKVCSTVFLDIAQAFDKVWHEGLCHKLEQVLPAAYSQLLKSYLDERYFRVKLDDEYSTLRQIKAGVPQGSVLGPVLYTLYTSDIPKPAGVTIATFADDTAILSVAEDIEESTEKLQRAVNEVNTWTNHWLIKLNDTKSVHVNFTNKRIQYIPVYINEKVIPHANTAKYLGMTLDVKLKWKAHVKKKREELGIKFKKMYWLLGRGSRLSIYNKILLYKQLLKPVWTYGIQLWGCTKPSNVQIIQRFQNKVLRNIVDAPWYIRNADLHRDLQLETVTKVIEHFAAKHEERLHQHDNIEAIQLLDVDNLVRRLKRTKPHELVK